MIDLEWLLAVLYMVGGLNDLFLDLVFYWAPLRRAVAQGRVSPRATEDELQAEPEKLIAILIPAWDESAVIGAMLESLCDRLDYSNYDVFVGTYPNDEATQFEVARAAFDRPRIHRVVCPNAGPTSKADCLNWVVEAIKLKESETGKRYEIFTLQDAEDVVDPLTLKVFNRFVPEYDLIQIPVIPYERRLDQLTGGTYLDEFAEVHLKGLHARVAVGGMVPSAGVGTAFGRAACDELAEQTNHVLFPPVSLTEDYDFSFRLYRNGRKSGLAEVWVDRVNAAGEEARELVAIREFFPARFRDAVRQKQRWMLGITFQGFEKLGWGETWRERYMLFRDRVGVLTSVLNAVALFVVFCAATAVAEALVDHLVWFAYLGRFYPGRWLYDVMVFNLLMLINRVVQRALCVARVARPRQMLMAPMRLVWSNVIDFYCTVHATRRYALSRWTGRPLKWLKTAHEFPTVESLLHRHRPLGDLLLEARLVSPEQLRNALDIQARSRSKKTLLGDLLVSLGAITREQLGEVLATQTRGNAAATHVVAADEMVLPSAEPEPGLPDEPAVAMATPDLVAAMPEVSHFPVEIVPQLVPIPAAIVPVAATLAGEQVAAFSALERAATHTFTHTFVFKTAMTRFVVTPASRRFSMLHTIDSKWATPLPSRRLVVAIGTRPEAIKLAPLIREMRDRSMRDGTADEVFVCATGQHQELVEDALAGFGVNVDLNLRLMGLNGPGQSLATQSASILTHFEAVLAEVQPAWVIVQGDTSTAAMASLAAFYVGIKVAHVEAGLRTHDLQQPFPEEFNRRMVGIYATMHFAATEWSKGNLLSEGVSANNIVVTGNTGIDALMGNCARLGITLPEPSDAAGAEPLPLVRVLVTAHRRENLDTGIYQLCEAIRNLVREEPGRYHFVWPLHPNPRVGEVARELLGDVADVTLTEPASYDVVLQYLSHCDLVLTDSGGLQEEAPSFGKPVLILRERTERPEGVRAGVAWLVGTNRERIEAGVRSLARGLTPDGTPFRVVPNPYGDGHASERIADFFEGRRVREFREVSYAAGARLEGTGGEVRVPALLG